MEVYFIQSYVTSERVEEYISTLEDVTLREILQDITIAKAEDILIILDGHHRLYAYAVRNAITIDEIKKEINEEYHIANIVNITNIPEDVILYDSIFITESEEIFAKSFPFANYLFVSELSKTYKPLNVGDNIIVTGIYKYAYTDPYTGDIYVGNMRMGFGEYEYNDFFDPEKVLHEMRRQLDYPDEFNQGFIYDYKPLVKKFENIYWFIREPIGVTKDIGL